MVKLGSVAIDSRLLLVLLIVVVAIAGYFALSNSGSGGAGGFSGTQNYGVLMGNIVDTAGNPIEGATVSVGTQTTTTNSQGWFSLSEIPSGSGQLVTLTNDGYTTSYETADIVSGQSSFLDVTLGAFEGSSSINSAVGGTVTTTDGGSMTLSANALVDTQGGAYSGTAIVNIATFDPTDSNEIKAFPGEFIGSNTQGSIVPIKSYGFMNIEVKDSSGNDLQLADGATATLKVPVPASMQSEAEALGACPMWYYDTETKYWIEEGSGTYDSATGSFIGEVSHLSTWNFDVSYPRAYISGRVVDGSGSPISGAQVECWGPGWTYSRWASGETCTAPDGTFTRIPVETGVIFQFKASKGGHDSSTYEIPRELEVDEEYDVGDIVLYAPTLQVTLTWGEDPSDLDSHFTSSNRDHVYYMDKGSLTTSPYINLDTDDTTSYGPEVVSASQLASGTYRYSIRHFSGDGNIQNSGAVVNAVIEGIGIYRFTPPSEQASGTDIWRVFDIQVGADGAISGFTVLNDYVTGGDTSEYLFP